MDNYNINSPLFLINKIKFETPDGIEAFYDAYSIEKMLEIDSFYSFADRIRDIFIKSMKKKGNVKKPHNFFSYYHLFEGLKKEINELDKLLSNIGEKNLNSRYTMSTEDYKKFQKECIDISNFSKFIYDKSKYYHEFRR